MGYRHCESIEFIHPSSAILRNDGVKNPGELRNFIKGERLHDSSTFGQGIQKPHALIRFDRKTKTYQLRVHVYMHKGDKHKAVAIYTDIRPMDVVVHGLQAE